MLAGPQLVVPLLNARFATNAANARWGSLYDALYGTDVIDTDDGKEPGTSYNPRRGDAVIARARAVLDDHVPLASGSHADATAYRVEDAALAVEVDGSSVALADPAAFVGYLGSPEQPEAVLLVHNGLHLEIQIDAEDSIGRTDRAGVKDVLMESAVSTIMDLEDSVAAVDAEDKVEGYRNWLRLMQGSLTADVSKGGQTFTRAMNPDRDYDTPDGGTLTLPGRALMFIREVGHLMTSDAVRTADGNEVPEGLLDALLCALGSLADVQGRTERRNSRTGAIYVVKPKMHGPAEVAFADEVFARVEQILELAPNTVKLGIMDEERRTSVNLAACIHAARNRVAFINTGFLDRTGDEIHTCMQAGPVVRKNAMRDETWIKAYEDNNVDVGLACGFRGRAQIGKGMWPSPDNMADMLATKSNHPTAGANCAWVPSPTAATLHALHYHEVDVAARQRELADREPARRSDLLVVPVAEAPSWSDEEITAELDNQRPGCPRLRRALDRQRRRLLEGSRHHRHPPHGGPRDLPDLLPTHRQLAAARRDHRQPGGGRAASYGRGRGRAERWRCRLHADGPGLRRRGVRRGARSAVRRGAAAERLYRAHPARPPPRTEGDDLMTPGLDHARTMIAGARTAGREHGLKPLTVVVLDAGGHVVAVEREDGSSIGRFDVAFGKAHGALSLGLGSRALMKRAEEQAYFIDAARDAVGPLVPVPGGVLIRDADGAVIGALGISGDASDNDEIAAVAGVEAAGSTADAG